MKEPNIHSTIQEWKGWIASLSEDEIRQLRKFWTAVAKEAGDELTRIELKILESKKKS
jgi:hypothetical protein